MALREEVILSIQRAQQQISQLESELSRASQPINVPVTVQGEEAITRLQTQLDAADETVDVRVQTFGLESADRTFAELSGSIDETRDHLQQAQVQADRLGDELATTGSRGATAFGTLRSAIGPLIATFAAGLGIREVVNQFNVAIDSAINLTESVNAINVVFGEGADVIQQFGETSAESVGLAASQVNQLVVPIGALLQNFGLEGREAADAALELTTRAADLASVMNTDVDEALQAIGSALRGEQEPIRAFGVSFDEAAVNAKALELGLGSVASELTVAEKGQARYKLLLEQSAFAAGDFAATAEDAANRQRTLNAALEEARADLGEALLPAFEALLDVAPELIDTLAELGPTFASGATSAADFLASLEPLTTNIPQITEGLGLLSDVGGLARATLFQTAETLGSLATFRFDDFISNLGESQEIINDLQASGARRVITIDFLNSLEEGEDNAEAFAQGLEDLFNASEGTLDVDTVEAFANAAGIADEEAASLVHELLLQARAAGASAAQLRVLEAILRNFGGIQPTFDGALVGFENLDGVVQNLASTTGAVEGADRAMLNLASGSDAAAEALLGTSAAFPIIVRDIEDLQLAAEDAGVSVTDFLNDIPDNVVLDLSQPQIAIATLIEELGTLDQRLAEFEPENVIDFDELIDEDTGQIDASLAEIRGVVNTQLGEEAGFQLNLSKIAVVAPDIAAILEAEGVDVAGDVAAKFAADLEEAGDQQAFIDGTKGLAAETAEQYGSFLKTLTPEELRDVAAFGPENLMPALQEQLIATGKEMAGLLDTTLGETTIAPELTIDLANIIFQNLPELTFDVSATGTTSTGTTNPPPGTAPPPPPVEVIINNPTTEDLNTSATQAAQTIGAVSTLLPRAQ